MLAAAWLLIVYGFAVWCAWEPGNDLLWYIWTCFANRENEPVGNPSPLVRSVGGLERALYVAAVMASHYELIEGWLALKAFFGFLRRPSETPGHHPAHSKPSTAAEKNTLEIEQESLSRYNGLLIGNALSLMIGLAAGIVGKWMAAW